MILVHFLGCALRRCMTRALEIGLKRSLDSLDSLLYFLNLTVLCNSNIQNRVEMVEK